MAKTPKRHKMRSSGRRDPRSGKKPKQRRRKKTKKRLHRRRRHKAYIIVGRNFVALTYKDAAVIMGMLARGDKNHDIAAWFGENPARIAEVKDGQAFGVVPAAPADELPQKGAVGPKA